MDGSPYADIPSNRKDKTIILHFFNINDVFLATLNF